MIGRSNLSGRASGRAVCLILLAILLGACAPPTQTQSQQGGGVTITFACPLQDRAIYRAAAEAFHQSNPDVEVRIFSTEDIISASAQKGDRIYGTLRQLARGTDTFLFSESAVEGGPAGLVLDLAPFIAASGAPTDGDFLPGLLARFRWQAGTWGLPAGVDPTVVFYEPAIFESTGLKPPAVSHALTGAEGGWSWDEFLNLAQQLTVQEGEQTVRYGFADRGYIGALSFIKNHGGVLVDTSVEPPRPALDDPRTVAAVARYADLTLRRSIMEVPSPSGFLEALWSRAAAMTIGNAGVHSGWDQGTADSLQVIPLPGGGPAAVRGYFISAGAAHPQAAWRWLQFLSGRVAPSGQLPARQSLIPDSTYASQMGEEKLAVYRYAAEHALPPVRPLAVEVLLDTALERIFAGADAQNVLAEAQQQALALPPLAAGEQFVVPSPGPAQTAEDHITFLTSGFSQAYPAMVEAFHETQPGIKVTLVNEMELRPPETPRLWRVEELISASHADCLQWMPSTMDDWDALLNLQPFIDADPTFPLEDYYPSAVEPLRRGGDLWGIPAAVDVPVFYFNHFLFDEAGLPYPEKGWTWNDVFLTAQKLSGGEGADRRYGFLIQPQGLPRLLDLLAVIGGEPLIAALVDQKATPPTFRFDASEVITLIQNLADLVEGGVVPVPHSPPSAEEAQQELSDLTASGRVGMWIDPSLGIAPIQVPGGNDEEREPASVAPWPADGLCVAPQLERAYYITADTSHAKSCWQWLHFLVDHNLQVGDGVPPRRSLLSSATFREQVGMERQAVYLEAMACKSPPFFSDLEGQPYSRIAYFWLEEAIREILFQGADAQAALSQAQKKAETYLACLRQLPDVEDRDDVLACAEQVGAPW